MGIRGELFSTKLILPNRSYFLNVKENRIGDLYLNIVESKNKETGGFERQSVIVFADDIPAFLGEFDKSLKALERALRDQKRNREENRGGGERPRRQSGKEGRGETGPKKKRITVRKRGDR
ncbi:MAG: PUR family DNA/RNA-binding protein [Treponema sp.]|jgi:hypothetical protein|nr:PUR family DNA/RNA-binding protein [Treponema sp.]